MALSEPGRRPTILVALFLQALPLIAQQPPVFHSDTSLALIRFQVVHDNTYVLNLKPEDIQLLEDGKPQKFTVFESGQTGRRNLVDLVLLFDISGSVLGARLLDPLVFKTSVLDGLPNVRLAVYGFSDDLRRYCRPTRDLPELEAAFRALGQRAPGETMVLEPPPKRSVKKPGTWIYESVIAAARDVTPKPDVHSTVAFSDPTPSNDQALPSLSSAMMLVFSDGLANGSSAAPEDASAVAQELGITVYPAVLGYKNLLDQINQAKGAGGNRAGNTDGRASILLMRLEAQQHEVKLFTQLGPLTGGRAFDLPQINLDVMRQILDFIVGQIRHQYLIGFVPEPSSSPRSHKLEVKLIDKSQGTLMGGTRTLVH
jgi:VWFA-related protein